MASAEALPRLPPPLTSQYPPLIIQDSCGCRWLGGRRTDSPYHWGSRVGILSALYYYFLSSPPMHTSSPKNLASCRHQKHREQRQPQTSKGMWQMDNNGCGGRRITQQSISLWCGHRDNKCKNIGTPWSLNFIQFLAPNKQETPAQFTINEGGKRTIDCQRKGIQQKKFLKMTQIIITKIDYFPLQNKQHLAIYFKTKRIK